MMNEMEERVARAISRHVHIISGSCDLEAAARTAIEVTRKEIYEECARIAEQWQEIDNVAAQIRWRQKDATNAK